MHSHFELFPRSHPPVSLVTSPNLPVIPSFSAFPALVSILTLGLVPTASITIPSPSLASSLSRNGLMRFRLFVGPMESTARE
ncbi:hypothetical protein K435DRAFT_777614 [Dendrothele bispora CBS 962.96]|uniref:Uncharacterized protein n=1 Tax=Dendrothele bispora (strain CBS 962.96) TaxID=1314807 RepID=A0A4S8M7A1_DENBC|nr:hypothetical protein K435DRAFT_777614 [Dendrothele bispora CBS 962.96]